MTEHRPLYPTDLSDPEWALLVPLLEKHGRDGPAAEVAEADRRRDLLPPALWLPVAAAATRVSAIDAEHRFHGVMSAQRTGRTVYTQFRRWRIRGAFHDAHDRLRCAVRSADGRFSEPSAAMLDRPTARTTSVDGPARGYDGAKRVTGRKRHLLIDTLGLVLLVAVHAPELPDRTGAQMLLSTTTQSLLPQRELVWADAAYAGVFASQLERIAVE